jgi:hypothetical protein
MIIVPGNYFIYIDLPTICFVAPADCVPGVCFIFPMDCTPSGRFVFPANHAPSGRFICWEDLVL